MDELASIISCPSCKSPVRMAEDHIACSACQVRFPIVDGKPILMRPDNAMFPQDDYVALLSKSEQPKGRLIGRLIHRFLPRQSVNLVRDDVLERVRRYVDDKGECRVLIVGVGRERQRLASVLQRNIEHVIVGTDVDVEVDADILCDAHDLPFGDGTFDAVITTAVLEHVLRPERVVSEIHRVLVDEGLVYSEIPFMQQVHAGPYDFTRYTRSGHIWLFRQFSIIDAGMVAGPGTALVWSIENFTMAFFQRLRFRQLASYVSRIFVFWLKYFDYIFAKTPAALDGASCTFFLGRKSSSLIADSDIISGYVGANYRTTYRPPGDEMPAP